MKNQKNFHRRCLLNHFIYFCAIFTLNQNAEQTYHSIRQSIVSAQHKLSAAVNYAMVITYWEIGEQIYKACGENDRAIDHLQHFLLELGQMQIYVNYYTREMMNEGDSQPIGIILCADKDDFIVKYTLSEDNHQIFASKYFTYFVDLFVRKARKTVQEKEKGSVLQKLKQELLDHKPAAPKKREPER